MVSDSVKIDLLTRCVTDLTSICEVLLEAHLPDPSYCGYYKFNDLLNKCKRRLESIDKAETVEAGTNAEVEAVSKQDSGRDQTGP